MSGKKSTPNNFSHSPFNDLKGLSVSDQPDAPNPEQEPPKPDPDLVIAREDPRAFEKEMLGLGVKRLERHADIDEAAEQSPVFPLPGAVGEDYGEMDDDALFQLAISGMDRVFKDDWSEEGSGPAAPRRLRQLKLGKLKPEAQLDLHGLTREEALDKVGFFLDNACHHGFRAVLIITGKGSRSTGGPVLRNAVIALLNLSQERILEWSVAPARYGGSGALVVFLRGKC
jgi:DNA-nicking Smr family endonuclease